MRALTVVARARAKKGSENNVAEALRGAARESRREAGCLLYVVHRDTADPAVFLTVERWRGEADIKAHMASPHVATLLAAISPWLAETPVISVLESLDNPPVGGLPG